MQCAALLDAPSPEGLRAALTDAVKRHEVLRTTFVRPVGVRDRQQVIHDVLDAAWRVEAADAEALAGDPERLSALLSREREQGFDVERGPLLRALLIVPDGGGRGLLVLTAHAACADTRSLLLLLDLLVGDAHASDEPIQYADYAEWRHEFIHGDDADASDGRAWWQAGAAELPSLPRLPSGSLEPPTRSATVAVPVALSPESLRAAAEAQRVPPDVFLEACWHATLARLTGESELVLASWLEGRDQPDLDSAIGPYAQPVPIRSRVDEGTSFAEVLDQVRRGRSEAANRQDYSSAGDHLALTEAAGIGFAHIAGSGPQVVAIHPPQIVPLMLVSGLDASGSPSGGDPLRARDDRGRRRARPGPASGHLDRQRRRRSLANRLAAGHPRPLGARGRPGRRGRAGPRHRGGDPRPPPVR